MKTSLPSSFRPAALAAVFCATIGLAALPSGEARAEGYLATQPTELEELVLGTDMIGYNVSVKEYSLETGQAYSLLIKSSGVKEYAIVAPDFFDYIWLLKSSEEHTSELQSLMRISYAVFRLQNKKLIFQAKSTDNN